MCAINLLHKKRIVFDFYTSHPMTVEEFNDMVIAWSLETEMLINKFGNIRCHIKESKEEAD